MSFFRLLSSTPGVTTSWGFPLASYSSRPVFSPLPINQLPGWVFSLAFLFLRPRRGFFRSYPTPHAQFSLRSPSISFRGGFSRLFFSSCTHDVVFSACFLLLTPSFLSVTYQSASGVGFHACFSLPAPTTWFFPLASYSSRPAFSPLPAYQLPGWVFSLAFLYPSPRRGFFRSLTTPHAQFCPPLPAYQLPGWVFSLAFLSPNPRHGFFLSFLTPHAQFSLLHLPISFQFGVSRLLFSFYTHDVGFSACFLLLTPSFLSVTYQSASGVGFHACFSLPAPTTWVFSLANTRAHQFNKMYLTMRSNSYIICLEFRSS